MKIERISKNREVNRVYVEIDSMPISLNPLLANDYISKFILSAMYEPLIKDKNCSIQKLDDLTYIIEIHQDFLGDSLLFLKTIQFHLNKENSSPYFKELICFKNALAVYKKQLSPDQIGVSIVNHKTFKVTLEYKIDYLVELIQSIFLAPVNTTTLTENGPYKLFSHEPNHIVLIRNMDYFNFVDSLVAEVHFILNTNINNSLSLYEIGEIDITCNTQFSHKNTHLMHFEDFCQSELNLFFLLKVKNRSLLEFIYKEFPREKIAKQLEGVVTPLYNLLDFQSDTGNIKGNVKDFDMLLAEEKLNISFANFYPNNLIIKEIEWLLTKKDISFVRCSFEDFESFLSTKENPDIELSLVMPTYVHYSSLIKTFIYDYSIELQKEIIDAMNNNKLQKLAYLLCKTQHYIPLFKGKSMYLKEPSLKGFHMNELGLLDLSKLTYL